MMYYSAMAQANSEKEMPSAPKSGVEPTTFRLPVRTPESCLLAFYPSESSEAQ